MSISPIAKSASTDEISLPATPAVLSPLIRARTPTPSGTSPIVDASSPVTLPEAKRRERSQTVGASTSFAASFTGPQTSAGHHPLRGVASSSSGVGIAGRREMMSSSSPVPNRSGTPHHRRGASLSPQLGPQEPPRVISPPPASLKRTESPQRQNKAEPEEDEERRRLINSSIPYAVLQAEAGRRPHRGGAEGAAPGNGLESFPSGVENNSVTRNDLSSTAQRTTEEVSTMFTQAFTNLLNNYSEATSETSTTKTPLNHVTSDVDGAGSPGSTNGSNGTDAPAPGVGGGATSADRLYMSKKDVLLNVVAHHGVPNTVTVILFLMAALGGASHVWKSLIFFVCVTMLFTTMEGFFVWGRARELRSRCINALAQAVGQSHAANQSSGNTRRESELGDDHTQLRGAEVDNGCATSLVHVGPPKQFFEGPLEGLHVTTLALQHDSFRPQHVIRDGRITVLPKLLVAKGDWILNRSTLKFAKFHGSEGISKLHDVMKLAIERCPVILAPVDAPRLRFLPNLKLAPDVEEDDISSDESDEEREPRSADNGGNVATVPQQMEYFVRRLLLLAWFFTLGCLLLLGFARFYVLGMDLSNFAPHHFFLYPAIACLGLLPLNVLISQRIFVLGANAALSCQLERLLTEEYQSFFSEYTERDLPTPTLGTLFKELKLILNLNVFHKIMCLSRNPVETLGTATVLAPLDSDGILTDQIPIPHRVIFVNKRPHEEEDESGAASLLVGEESFAPSEEVTENERIRMQQRVARAKLSAHRTRFRTQRLTQMGLCASADDNLAVIFEDDRLLQEKRSNTNSLVLCCLLHSIHNALGPQHGNSHNALVRHLDDTPMWSRCCHWLSRAAGFSDSIGAKYHLLRRVVRMRTASSTHKSNPQVCSLLLAHGSELHLFSLGSVDMVLPSCSTYWTGDALEEFESEDKKGLRVVGVEEWQRGRQYQVIACSHRVVPRQYIPLLLPKGGVSKSGYQPLEDYYLDNERVTSKKKKREEEGDVGGTGRRSPSRSGARSEVPHPSSPTNNLAPSSLDDPNRLNQARTEPRSWFGMECKTHFEFGAAFKLLSEGAKTTDDLDVLLAESSQQSSQDDEDDLFTPKERKMGINTTPEEVLRRLLTTRQAFLGFVGLRDMVRPNVETVVNALSTAGIRFMHFGNDTEKHTNAFGTRVGLEAEWNSCVSLRQSDTINLEDTSRRAQLPHGIRNIRRHLQYKDNIPLQVSLFSHCKTVSTRAMISVLQDNHEVVCVLGSGLNHGCIRSFLQGDIAITTTPSFTSVATEKNNFLNRDSEDQLLNNDMSSPTWKTLNKVTKLTSSLCALQVPPHASALSIIVCLIRESRLLLRMISNSTEFMIQCNCALVLLHIVTLILGLPLCISPMDTVWFLNAFVPILGLGVAYRRMSSVDVMKQLKAKHCYHVRWGIFYHSFKVFRARYIPSLVIVLVVSVSIFLSTTGLGLMELFWHDPQRIPREKLDEAQGVILSVYSYFTVFHALTHISRHQQLRLWARAKNRKRRYVYVLERVRWFLCSIFGIVLQFGYLKLSGNEFKFHMDQLPVTAVVLVCLWPFAILAVDVPVKSWRWHQFQQRQKFRKLMFGTRLGMHSPHGDYEPGHSSSSSSSEGDGEGGSGRNKAKTVMQKVHRFIFFFTTIHNGHLERQCVCDECDRWM